MFKSLSRLYKKNKGLFMLDLFAAFMMSSIDVVFPVIVSYIIDELVPKGDMRLLGLLCIAALCGYILMYAFEFTVNYFGHILGTNIETMLREELFEHYETLSFSFFDSQKTGAIISRLTTDIFDISEFAHHGPENLFISFIILIGSAYFMFKTNVLMAFALCMILPIMGFFALKNNTKWTYAQIESKKQNAVVTSEIEDTFSGIRVVKAFTNEKLQHDKFCGECENYKTKRKRTYKYMSSFSTTTHFFTNLLNLVVVFLGGLLIYQGKLSAGSFVEFIMFVNIFIKPVRNITALAEDYQKCKTGLMRWQEIMDIPAGIKSPEKPVVIDKLKGDISFDKVSFEYLGTSEVLKEFSLDIAYGESVAIVGRSGAGKSTLCSLIPRFYDVSAGAITIDGIDIRSYELKKLRENIGIVQQDVFLFNGTIRENIASLPYGYETIVGDRGIKLSGGQKQRVAIARIFLKNPPILILDEATSSLDNDNEKIIAESFEKLSQNRTTITIAHRLQTIEKSKRIIVLDNGRIAEEGTHDSLINAGGIYCALYQAQKNIQEE